MIIDLLSWACLVGGGIVGIIGGIGMLRFPDFFTRQHASGVTDTLGAFLILLGLALQAGLTLATFKLALIFLFLFFTSPTASHALASAAVHDGVMPLLDDSPEDAQ